MDRELRNEALAELCALVEDWKNHEVTQFGDLLLHGQFTVVTGKSDVEKEVRDIIHYFKRHYGPHTARAVAVTVKRFIAVHDPALVKCLRLAWTINHLTAWLWLDPSSIHIIYVS